MATAMDIEMIKAKYDTYGDERGQDAPDLGREVVRAPVGHRVGDDARLAHVLGPRHRGAAQVVRDHDERR